MVTLQKYTPFFASAILMCLVLFFIYPFYQYYVDPDGTAYLTISQRYAAGDFQRAVNGYWSPWSCWLTALFIKGGIAAIPASVIINTIAAVGFLFVSHSFFVRCNIMPELQWMLDISLALLLCSAIFWQSFDDLWECFFLLCTLRLMLIETYKDRPALWVCCGIIGALAYFAKAYSFPFFILHTLCCAWIIADHNKGLWIRMSAVAILFMIACSLPWIWALHHKYGIWATSTAGPLNTSWYLVGHPNWKQGIDLLIPPPYPDSPYYWEDPYYANGVAPHFWNSLSLFGMQLLRIGYNTWKLFKSMFQLSALFPLVFLLFFLFILLVWKHSRKVISSFPHQAYILGVSFVLFPLGFLLVNFEPRYIWYMVPPGMVLGALNIQNMQEELRRYILAFVFPLSFIVYPLHCMKIMYREGEHEYTVASQLRQLNIHGTFTAIAKPGLEAQRIERLAYFSGNTLYSIPKQDAAQKDILREMRRYHINYFVAYNTAAETFADENGAPFPEVTKDQISGIRVFLVNR